MKLDIKFSCHDCWRANQDKSWSNHVDDEWETLSAVLEHQRKNPDHDIRAEAEVEINL